MTSFAPCEDLLDSYINAAKKGWWDAYRDAEGALDRDLVWAALPEKLALVHSELTEALEEVRRGHVETYFVDGAPHGYYSELADAAIRIYGIMGALARLDMGLVYTIDPVHRWEAAQGVPGKICEVHDVLTGAYRGWKSGFHLSLQQALVRTISCLNQLCVEGGADLNAEVRIKTRYNKTRPFRHGGLAF